MAFFNKNKQAKEKRKGENLVGKIIYCFLLFAPLLSILFTSLYTTFNKNAYQSYYGKTINEIIPIETTINELESGKEYNAKIETQSNRQGNITIYSNTNLIVNNVEQEGYTWFAIFQSTNTLLGLYGNDVTTQYLLLTTASYTIEFTYNSYNAINNSDALIDFSYNTYNKNSYLDNAFEYGTVKVENSDLYNWAKNTGTYTVMHSTTQQLGIENTFIPMLMSYWLIISVIYFIYDIALILIWALHRRIHDLGDSI